jgi:CubicO group peptidase (beta-lactamase class C family)
MIFSALIIKAQNSNTIVAKQIDSIRIAHGIPSIAYGVIRNDSIIVINTVGYRDIETKERSQSEDLYHIGSNGKAFTGFLAAKMVEDNLIKWDTKFFDLYPELKNESNTAYYDISLKELLSHRARIINFEARAEIQIVINKYRESLSDSLSLPERRYHLVKEVLKFEPLPKYDECKRSYSNAGFIAAALMLEKVTGQSWETLMKKLSDDLNLGIHIGSPIDFGIHQPKGHINPKHYGLDIDKDLIPVQDEQGLLPVDFYEFLQLCTPSGNISLTVNDFLKFLQLNINGINGKNYYLKSETYQQIFSAYPFYTMGWFNVPQENLRYSHRGSNMMFNSFAGMSPENKLGIVIMINTRNDYAITQTLNLLLKNYVKKAYF